MRTRHKRKVFAALRSLPNKQEPTSRLQRLDLNGLHEPVREQSTVAISDSSYFTKSYFSVRGSTTAFISDWFRFHQTKWHGFRQVGNAFHHCWQEPWDVKLRFISYSITATREPDWAILSCCSLMHLGRLQYWGAKANSLLRKRCCIRDKIDEGTIEQLKGRSQQNEPWDGDFA